MAQHAFEREAQALGDAAAALIFRSDANLDAVQVDKKFRDREVRFVVTPRLGTAYVSSDVTLDDIRNVVARL